MDVWPKGAILKHLSSPLQDSWFVGRLAIAFSTVFQSSAVFQSYQAQDNEKMIMNLRLCAMKPLLKLERFPPLGGVKSGITYQQAT